MKVIQEGRVDRDGEGEGRSSRGRGGAYMVREQGRGTYVVEEVGTAGGRRLWRREEADVHRGFGLY